MGAIADFLLGDDAIRWVQQWVGLGHPGPFRVLSLFGDTWGIFLAAGLARWYFDRSAAVAVAVAGVLTAPLWLALASLFSVDRPGGPGIVVYEQLEAGAFPSGHVFHAVVVWGVLAGLTRFPAWAALAAALATGLGRLYLGVHYPADILASLVLAPLFVVLFIQGWHRLEPGAERWPTGVWIAATLGMAAVVTGLLLGPLDPGRLRRWEIVGTLYAGPAALGLHYRWARLRGARRGPLGVLVGVLGLSVLGLASRVLGPELPWVAAPITAAALLWVFAAVPALIANRGR